MKQKKHFRLTALLLVPLPILELTQARPADHT